jgi:hypothetical protein
MTAIVQHRFTTGSGTAIVGPAGAALVACGPGDPIVAKLRRHLLGGETFAHLVESLLQAGLEGLTPFAVVSAVDDGHRLLIRGDVHADVQTGERVDHLTGANLTVWREESYTEIDTVVFCLEGVGELEFEVNAGVVPAAALSYTTTSHASAGPSSTAPLAAATKTARLAPTPAAAEPAAETSTVAAFPTPVKDPAMEELGTVAGPEAVGEPAVDQPAIVEAAPVVEELDVVDEIDNEHTVIRQSASVREPAADTAPVPTESVESAPGLISGRPQHFGPAETPTPSDPDHDGRTEIRRPTPPAIAATVLPPTADLGPTVHAITCPQGHPNPVTQGRCRQCDVEIIERASVTIPRPPLGVLRFSNNEVVDLDGPITIGRMPPSDPIDGAAPHVLAIDNSELSRFHALITVDQWFVYVVDQGSTNETSVIVPGREPITCRAHERVLVPPGAVVNLGGAVTCRFDII